MIKDEAYCLIEPRSFLININKGDLNNSMFRQHLLRPAKHFKRITSEIFRTFRIDGFFIH